MSLNGQDAWNRASALYQRNQQLLIEEVHYGPWSPGENELKLLGDLRGKRVLDIGCGGGQNGVALVKQGATVTGVDFSQAQLDYAHQLAATRLTDAEQSNLRLVQSDAEALDAVASGAMDLVLSVNTLHYVAPIDTALHECWRVLVQGGRLIFSVDHPLRSCFIDEEADELAIYPIRSYFDPNPLRWQFPESGAWMVSYHHTVAEWIDLLIHVGFQLQRVIEPVPTAELADALWPLDGPHAELRHIPQTILFVAEKC